MDNDDPVALAGEDVDTSKLAEDAKPGKPGKQAKPAFVFGQPLAKVANSHPNILVYGKEGSGKTVSALSVSSLGKTLVFNIEGGIALSSLKNFQIDIDNITVADCDTNGHFDFDKMVNILNYLKSLDEIPFEYIVIDSISELCNKMIELSRNLRLQKKNLVQDESSAQGIISNSFTELGDYGNVKAVMQKLISILKDLHCTVIFTALQKREEDSDTGVTRYTVDCMSSVANYVLGIVDTVIYQENKFENGTYKFIGNIATKSYKFNSKDREGVYPATVENPFIAKLLKIREEALNGSVK